MDNKVLTVSIAAFNVEKYIHQTLDVFVDKDILKRVEVFIIDDGGSDSTINIAKEYAQKYPDTFFPVCKNDEGWGSTVNYGIKHASGKYFKQLDGDDYFDRENLIKLLDILEDTAVDVVYTPYCIVNIETGEKVIKKCISINVDSNKVYSLEKEVLYINPAMHCCTFRTEILKENVHVIENVFYADVDYLMKGLANAKTIKFLNLPIYIYRVSINDQSTSYFGYKKHYKDHEAVTFELLNYFNSNSDNYLSNFKTFFRNRINYMIRNQYSIYYYIDPTDFHKHELIEFDHFIKTHYKSFYGSVPFLIKGLRIFDFSPYRILVEIRIKHKLK